MTDSSKPDRPKGGPHKTGRSKLALPLIATGIGAALAAALFPPLRSALRIEEPSDRAFLAAEEMFAEAMADPAGTGWHDAARELGLVPQRPAAAWPGVLLAEAADDCAGRGIYLLRQPPAAPLAITAPHRGADKHTAEIAAALFVEMPLAAAAWSSAPRRASAQCAAAIDLARQDRHPFTAFSLAFARAHPRGLVVQLHGFDGARRSSAAARLADMIVSAGTREPGARVLDLADCLSRTLAPRRVLVFPHETGELGALTNAQGRALRQAGGFDGFVHLEMAPDLRRQLVADKAMRARLAACLREVTP